MKVILLTSSKSMKPTILLGKSACCSCRVQQTKSKPAKEYQFDKVFGPETTQEQLFKECNIPFLLDKTIEGYHATLFAYGQTGVGKTYTMEGYDYSINKEKDKLKPIIKVF